MPGRHRQPAVFHVCRTIGSGQCAFKDRWMWLLEAHFAGDIIGSNTSSAETSSLHFLMLVDGFFEPFVTANSRNLPGFANRASMSCTRGSGSTRMAASAGQQSSQISLACSCASGNRPVTHSQNSSRGRYPQSSAASKSLQGLFLRLESVNNCKRRRQKSIAYKRKAACRSISVLSRSNRIARNASDACCQLRTRFLDNAHDRFFAAQGQERGFSRASNDGF